MEKTFWMVWTPETKETKGRHTSFENAVAAAERASVLNPGTRFYVVQAQGYAVTGRWTEWHDLEGATPA